MSDDAQKDLAVMLAAVGEPTRLRIIRLLIAGPRNVGEIAKELGIVIVNASHHLGILRNAKILHAVKEGRFVRYSLNPEVFHAGKSADHDGVIEMAGYRLEFLKLAGSGKRKAK
jgi:DNA-binding transcriptional ArsR family regulator